MVAALNGVGVEYCKITFALIDSVGYRLVLLLSLSVVGGSGLDVGCCWCCWYWC